MKNSFFLLILALSLIFFKVYSGDIIVKKGKLFPEFSEDILSYDIVVDNESSSFDLIVNPSIGNNLTKTIFNQKHLLKAENNAYTFSLKESEGEEIILELKKSEVVIQYTFRIFRSAWKLITDSASFKPRDGAGVVVLKNKLYLLGGWTGMQSSTVNEVWTSEDGKVWKFLGNAPWSPRHGAGYAIFKDKIWIIGGDGNTDAWSSDDGVKWHLELSSAPWGERYSPLVLVFNNKLWLMGGQWYKKDPYGALSSGSPFGYNDVWSSDDGKNWIRVNSNAPWSPRGLIHGSVVHKGRMWIMGGGIKGFDTIIDFNDVWSSKDGITWKLVTPCADWMPRTHFSIASYKNKMWITDGSGRYSQANYLNDVWYSKSGRKWKELKKSLWSRRHASSLFVFRDKLWITSGLLVNDVWVMDNKALSN